MKGAHSDTYDDLLKLAKGACFKGSKHELQVLTSHGNLLLIRLTELKLACSNPKMFVDYSSLRDKDRLHNPRSTERSYGAECHCDFCEFQKKYEVQFEEIKHTMEKGKSIDLHEEDERFFVTTAETGYILKSLSAKVFSGSISQPEQMKTTGILVPSVYDLNNGDMYSPKPVKGAVSIYCRDDFVGICLFQDKIPDSPQSSFSGFIFAQVVSENSNEGTELKNRHAGESSRQAAAKLRSRQNSRYDHWIDMSSFDEHQADTERRTAAFRPVNREEERLMLNQNRVTETFVMMLCQTAATVWSASNTSNSLSRNVRVLSTFSTVCNITGFLCLLYAIFVFDCHPGITPRILRGIGYTVTAFAFLAVLAMRLDDDLNLWITATACIIAFPALARAFRR